MGAAEGETEGVADGSAVGVIEGALVDDAMGDAEGAADGLAVGSVVGRAVGEADGVAVGILVGVIVGDSVEHFLVDNSHDTLPLPVTSISARTKYKPRGIPSIWMIPFCIPSRSFIPPSRATKVSFSS